MDINLLFTNIIQNILVTIGCTQQMDQIQNIFQFTESRIHFELQGYAINVDFNLIVHIKVNCLVLQFDHRVISNFSVIADLVSKKLWKMTRSGESGRNKDSVNKPLRCIRDSHYEME